ncbi:hypothetical protein [Sphingomonas sp.]|uniref:hypothetical protein n=1 Tax=Sphingomonas sp. TaxID=28214 RepID=UPI00261F87E4|nr:hypothetical protein [Sphingomonas sp.]MDF2496257.1 rane protein of unknown function [Sphingomonas sp.]
MGDNGTMWRDIRQLYADCGAFALALPILFSVPAVLEFAQHVVEIKLGLFSQGLGAAAAFDQRRLSLGFAKSLAMLLPAYWFVRFMASRRDADWARKIERPAATLYGVQFALLAMAQWLSLFGPPPGLVLGLPPHLWDHASLLLGALGVMLGIYLAAWWVAWPLGNSAIGPLRSIAVMIGSFWRALIYMLAGFLPLAAVHQLLNALPIGAPEWIVWLAVTIDSLVVGFLALSSAGAVYLAARHAARRRNITLLAR